ncbi:MAG: hypothetical protein WB629_05665 [Candidatus Sulfotelmatobacter sp.]
MTSFDIRSPADVAPAPAKPATGGLFPQAGVIPIAIAGVLASGAALRGGLVVVVGGCS